VKDLTVEELDGGYRMLCRAMLTHTARLMSEFGDDGRSSLALTSGNKRGEKMVSYTKEVARQREAAQQWVSGGGALGFDECCEEVGLRPTVARQRLGRFVEECNRQSDRSQRFASPRGAARIAKGYQP
jgi:hypothetical protein